jgi:DNA-binding beta-propeller fold protein YncE
MKTLPLFITACFLSLSLVIPAATVQSEDNPSNKTDAAPWIWPPAPDKPRVKHLKTFITPQDLGVTKGFFARLWDFVAGEDTVDRILSPHGVVADGEGKVYVVDWGAGRVHYFNFDRKKYDQFGKTKDGELESPIGAALDADGLLYVSDSARRRVFVYSGTKNKRVIGDDNLLRPTGIAVNKNEKLLYVVDTLGHRVDVFDLSGNRVRSFGKRGGGQGEFNYPVHIALDAGGDVYVMDTLNFRVQIFDKEGKFLSQFGSNGTAIGAFMKPKGIAVDSEGHIWVSDGLRNSVQVFDRKGTLLLIFGKKGTGAGEFDIPAGLYIDSRDRLYVADSYNYRVQMFQYLKQ